MEAVLIVARRDRLRHFRFDLEADVVGQQQIFTRGVLGFRNRERGRQARCRRMRQQAIDAILRNRELRIVVVIRMHADAVRESCKTLRHMLRRADHGRVA